LGDAALLLPLAATIWLWLLMSRAPRAALAWAAAVGFCCALTAVLKIFFWGCPPISELRSPSGHTSFSTLVYGAIAVIVAVEGGRRRPQLAAASGAGLVLAIAASRLLLDAHSLAEVVIGSLIGGAFLALFGRAYWRRRPQNARLGPLLVAVTLLISAVHGSELHAEGLLHRITAYLGIDCR
jgi:membrane-associated phospholipid phosphatase